MRFTLINPDWSFEGSTYFGCREPHLPLELGYAKAMLESAGHGAALIDGHMEELSDEEITRRAAAFRPDWHVIVTAPTYLFWRCPQPELRIPMRISKRLSGGGARVAIAGPHGSVTAKAVLKKTGADCVIIGEPEQTILALAEAGAGWKGVRSIAFIENGNAVVTGGPRETDVGALPALKWDANYLKRHRHHHHRFDSRPDGPGAEVESSRGCPYMCTFCAKKDFRNRYRKRRTEAVIEEIEGLVSSGVDYIYFIDEIFLPDKRLLEALYRMKIRFAVQSRIDLWSTDMLDLLGKAGCVSFEAGIESISEEGRALLGKKCPLTTDEITGLLIHARKSIRFVQATLLDSKADHADAVERWRKYLNGYGVWANKPVPLFPYPGSGEYERLWGLPDDLAWERAHARYLRSNVAFSDIQEERPKPLSELEYGE